MTSALVVSVFSLKSLADKLEGPGWIYVTAYLKLGGPVLISRVGQNHIYTVYIQYFWLQNHQIYGVYIRIYTVRANPNYKVLHTLSIGLN